MDTPTNRPGWRTTEFWITLVTSVIALAAVLLGLGPAQTQGLTDAAVKLAVAAVALVGQVAAAVKYVEARHSLKAIAWQVYHEQTCPPAPDGDAAPRPTMALAEMYPDPDAAPEEHERSRRWMS